MTDRPRAALWFVHALGDSSEVFERVFETELAREYDLVAPDWPAVASTDVAHDLDHLAAWLVGEIERHSPVGPLGLIGHSLGAAVAVRAAQRLARVAGLFSIEGNLTAADAYFSGLAAEFGAPEEYRRYLLDRIEALADSVSSSRRAALVRYHASVRRAAAESLWTIGRAARAAGRDDALGYEYAALSIPKLYYWSPDNAPAETRAFIHQMRLEAVTFKGGHWPMVEQPAATAGRLRRFFASVFAPNEPRANATRSA